jgi:5'-phosphate synthase pdxT subunit
MAEAVAPPQRSLGFLDVTVERNAYGRQKESFESTGVWTAGGSLEVVFIRAPRIRSVGAGVEVLAVHAGEPILVGQGRMLGATFHPELTEDPAVHRLLIRRCVAPAPTPEAEGRTVA